MSNLYTDNFNDLTHVVTGVGTGSISIVNGHVNITRTSASVADFTLGMVSLYSSFSVPGTIWYIKANIVKGGVSDLIGGPNGFQGISFLGPTLSTAPDGIVQGSGLAIHANGAVDIWNVNHQSSTGKSINFGVDIFFKFSLGDDFSISIYYTYGAIDSNYTFLGNTDPIAADQTETVYLCAQSYGAVSGSDYTISIDSWEADLIISFKMFDSHRWINKDEKKWSQYNLVDGFSYLPYEQAKRWFHSNTPAFNTLGEVRDPIPGDIGQVYQVDFRITKSNPSDTNVVLGLRADSIFDVTPTIIYAYLNHFSGQPLNMQTFPSANRQPFTINQWYTMKARTIADNVEIYIHGGQEGFNNLLLGSGPFSGIQSGNVYFNVNVASLTSGGFCDLRNYYVTNSLNFTPPSGVIDMATMNHASKEFFV